MPMVALLMPASSPGWRSSSSSLKPLRSPQRMNMRISISAQSWDSVPPAPALMLTSAPLRSYGPDSMRANSILPTASSAAASVVPASTAVASSLASSASSIRTPASSAALRCASNPSTVDFSRD
jgi:hypothetical protein